MANNVLGSTLAVCCMDPVTGYYRNGKCDTGTGDMGMHTVCVQITKDFLLFAKSQGNDLITPMPSYDFPGLQEGDRWCVCLRTVQDAWKAGVNVKIHLESTHLSVLEFIDLKELEEHRV